MKRKKLTIVLVLLVVMATGCMSDENNNSNLDGTEYSDPSDSGNINESEFDGAEYSTDNQETVSEIETLSSTNIKVLGNGDYSEEIINDVNLVIMVSNQSLHKPNVEVSGYLNEVKVFNDNFEVGDQHEVTYYYLNLEAGEHSFSFETENVAKQLELVIKEDEKLWVMASYWESEDKEPSVDIYESNEPILID